MGKRKNKFILQWNILWANLKNWRRTQRGNLIAKQMPITRNTLVVRSKHLNVCWVTFNTVSWKHQDKDPETQSQNPAPCQPSQTSVLCLVALSGAAVPTRNIKAHLHIHLTSAFKLTPQIKVMMVTVALSARLVILVLALMRVPMLRAMMKSERVSPRIID